MYEHMKLKIAGSIGRPIMFLFLKLVVDLRIVYNNPSPEFTPMSHGTFEYWPLLISSVWSSAINSLPSLILSITGTNKEYSSLMIP